MPRAAWYRGTDIEKTLMEFGEWLAGQTMAMGTAASYRSHVAQLLRDGIQTEADIWAFSTGDMGGKNTRACAWRHYQRFLDEKAGRGGEKMAPGVAKAVKAFTEWLVIHKPTWRPRTINLYGGILRRILACTGQGTLPEVRAAVESLAHNDRSKARLVWHLFSQWYVLQPKVTQAPPDPWFWDWTLEGAKALRVICSLEMTHSDRLQMRWKDIRQDHMGAWQVFWPNSYDFIDSISHANYAAWQALVEPKDGEAFLIPEFPGSTFPASYEILNQLLESSAHLIRSYQHLARHRDLNQTVIAAKPALLDGTWGVGKRERPPEEIENIVDPTNMIKSGLAIAEKELAEEEALLKMPKVNLVLNMPVFQNIDDDEDDFY